MTEKELSEIKKRLQERNTYEDRYKLEGIELAEKLAKQELIREIEMHELLKDIEIIQTIPRGDLWITKSDWQSLKKRHGVE